MCQLASAVAHITLNLIHLNMTKYLTPMAYKLYYVWLNTNTICYMSNVEKKNRNINYRLGRYNLVFFVWLFCRFSIKKFMFENMQRIPHWQWWRILHQIHVELISLSAIHHKGGWKLNCCCRDFLQRIEELCTYHKKNCRIR